jgi:hypothetical protein
MRVLLQDLAFAFCQLRACDHLDGWARYEKAGIAVVDMATETLWISAAVIRHK